MPTSREIGFGEIRRLGSPTFDSLVIPVILGGEFDTNAQIIFSPTARLLASSDRGSNGYFPGDNIVVADFDNRFLELQLVNLGLSQPTSGQFTFNYAAPNVADGELSVEIFDTQLSDPPRRIGFQSLARTNGTYEIFPTDSKITVRFEGGIPSLIRIGGVLREFGIDNIQLTTGTGPITGNTPPTINGLPSNINAQIGTPTPIPNFTVSDAENDILTIRIREDSPSIDFPPIERTGTAAEINALIANAPAPLSFISQEAGSGSIQVTVSDPSNPPVTQIVNVTVGTSTGGNDTLLDVVVGNNVTANSTGSFIGATSSPGVTGLPNANPPDKQNIATQFGDTITGGLGRDILLGIGDNDLLFAASITQSAGGNDSLSGGQGNDTLVGARIGFSADTLSGDDGNDLLIASDSGGNTLLGGQGDDTIYGSITGSSVLNGEAGSDVLIAGRLGDRTIGGDGNDTLIGGVGNDNMFDEAGGDRFEFSPEVPDSFTGVDQIIRSRGGFGGTDFINDFSTGDGIFISGLDSYDTLGGGGDSNTVTITTNNAGAAEISINGASNRQSARQTITVVGVTRDELLAPGSQLLSINGTFITLNDRNIFSVDGSSRYLIPPPNI